MTKRMWIQGLSVVAIALLAVACSVPDGPDPGESAVNDESETAAEEITLSGPGQLLPITATAVLNEVAFDLEVAQTPQQQALGLMFRSALPDNRGMLFPFGRPRPASFWMRDVPVPLDMVFMRDGVVVAIESEAPPCPALPCPSYGPESGVLVDQVLELRGGRAAEIGLTVGDEVSVEPLPEPDAEL